MVTILEALKAKDETVKGATIAEALGGSTIAGALSATDDSDDGEETTEYTITFDLNTGTGTAPSSVTGAAGDSVTLPDGTGITAPEGKEFKGWGETASAESALESYTISKDATLYAVYAAAASGTE